MSSMSIQDFESAVMERIVDGFKFKNPSFNDVVIESGRNIFVQDMPEVEDIKQTQPLFEPEREPVICIFTDGTPNIETSSSRGGKLDWNLRFFLRFGDNPETAKGLHEELFQFVLQLRGRSEKFFIKGVFPLARPTVLRREGDGHLFVSAVIRFLVVALN